MQNTTLGKTVIRLLRQSLINEPQMREEFLTWYYNTEIWKATTFLGVTCLKAVTDMWNYQEIIFERKPSLIIEFGTNEGGSTLFFATILTCVNPTSKVFSVDINPAPINLLVQQHPHIELMMCSSTDRRVYQRIQELHEAYPGPIFAIVDSDHTKQHVFQEMELLRTVLQPGDYLVVEDGIINHPILPGWGEGPMEALLDYFKQYPNDYEHDFQREQKFGLTFAPMGYLIRK